MSCDCHLEARNDAQKKVLKTLLVINGAMFAAEIIVGILADSSGVIADSLDMLADALVYGISLYAIGRSSSIKVGAARWSGWFQVALAGSIVLDVVRRAILGSEPNSTLMFAVSCFALGANAYCLILLAKHRQGEVHMRASWVFTRSDVIANAGVIVAALLVALTGTRWPDLIVGAAIAGVVIAGGISILVDANAAGRTSGAEAGLEPGISCHEAGLLPPAVRSGSPAIGFPGPRERP
jgi:Co/Zn/Cd efflux system component